MWPLRSLDTARRARAFVVSGLLKTQQSVAVCVQSWDANLSPRRAGFSISLETSARELERGQLEGFLWLRRRPLCRHCPKLDTTAPACCVVQSGRLPPRLSLWRAQQRL